MLFRSRGDIVIDHVPTKDQLADIFTKPLDDARFCYLRNELNIVDSGSLTWLSCIHTYILSIYCVGVGMDLGGVLS